MQLFFSLASDALWALTALIFLGAILSWFRIDPRQPLIRLLHGIIDPVLHPIRVLIPPMGGMDFSPLIAVLLLGLLKSFLDRASLP